MLWPIPLAAIMASLIGWLLASLAPRPAGKMIREARQMKESRFHVVDDMAQSLLSFFPSRVFDLFRSVFMVLGF